MLFKELSSVLALTLWLIVGGASLDLESSLERRPRFLFVTSTITSTR
jgi:hypothetical protein